MMRFGISSLALLASCLDQHVWGSPETAGAELERRFLKPPEEAKPWVLWYWMKGAISREGITADLEAMAEAGLGGAYTTPIFGPDQTVPFEPKVAQLTPEFWGVVDFALSEAERLGLKLSFHICDGFALAGGPWITPEESMQKVVWTRTFASGASSAAIRLPQPETVRDYYRDIIVLAYPRRPDEGIDSGSVKPVVTSSIAGEPPQFLADPENTQPLRSESPCWIQYAFAEPFTCRSIVIRPHTNNYQANRLIVHASDDGVDFRRVARLESPRHGWQDTDAFFTHAIPPTTARYFRFEFTLDGTEPGAEDLDRAKWKPSLKLRGIELHGESRIHQYEGKSGQVWRVAPNSRPERFDELQIVDRSSMLDLSNKMRPDGTLDWTPPDGEWTILRIGHTSTGHENATAGAGRGLEADKFRADVARKQFDNWIGKAIAIAGPERTGKALDGFYIDSWECGSQNWSPVFKDEFLHRKGYDLDFYLPLFAGVPVENVEESERVLRDVREVIGELVNDNFFGTFATLAREAGCRFSAENVAPTMVSDAMRHYENVDTPMGEFWLRSPTHDKPKDILDAVSGARIYGKRIVAAEAFTELRMAWDEHPGMLKALGDRNFALGINKFAMHVFTHNPFLDRVPGVTLNGVGLYFQRNQTWWTAGRAWIDYLQRCQSLLQMGVPIVDVAVYTGDEVPRRAVLPHRLVSSLPGVFGEQRVEEEKERLANSGQPERSIPAGVKHSANMADPEDWVDPLRGYAYDSINQDALLRLAAVEDGRIVLPGGASYAALVVPSARPMAPNGSVLREATSEALRRISDAGGRIVFGGERGDGAIFGVPPDLTAVDSEGRRIERLAWTHRRAGEVDFYFLANGLSKRQSFALSLRETGRVPELWDPVDGTIRPVASWNSDVSGTRIRISLEASQSMFIVLRAPTDSRSGPMTLNERVFRPVAIDLKSSWKVRFPEVAGEPSLDVAMSELHSWSESVDTRLAHFSGTASYETTFRCDADGKGPVWLDLGEVANIAEIFVNDVSCGVAWTTPYRVRIDAALRDGLNTLRIEVSNTWANRLIAEAARPESERRVWTLAPLDQLKGKPLLPGGLLGPVIAYEEHE